MDPKHPAVLQQPPYFGDSNTNGSGSNREDRGRLSDILNPGPASSVGPGPSEGARGGMSMPTGPFGQGPGPAASHGPPHSQPPSLLHHQPGGRPSSSFSLRSPTHSSDYHHSQHPPPSPLSYAASGAAGGPRSILNPPFISSTAASGGGGPALPPPSLQPPVGLVSSSSGLHPPDRTSPLHAPAVYYRRDSHDRDYNRERQRDMDRDHQRHKSGTGSFYDPTTDSVTASTANNNNSNSSTSRDRQRSDTAGTWHNHTKAGTHQQPISTPNARDPYNNYTQPPSESAYYNGNGNNSNYTPSYPRPRSPVSHSHPGPSSAVAASVSPVSSKPPKMDSPILRRPAAMSPDSTPAALPALGRATSPVSSSRTAGPSTSTPSRNVMSVSNILSGAEPVPSSRPRSPVAQDDRHIKVEPTEKADKVLKTDKADKKPARRPGKRASEIKNAESTSTPKATSRRASSKVETPTSTRVPVKRQANGAPKQKTPNVASEKRIRGFMEGFDSAADQIVEEEYDEEAQAWRARTQRRRRDMEARDHRLHQMRRDDFVTSESKKLLLHADLGRRRFDEEYFDTAMTEVREQELFAEKERKKDMQRKRRREKSMATTMEQKAAAIAKALAARDETERQKHLREAERASRKVQQTKLVLQKGIKGPSRSAQAAEPSVEGTTPVQADTIEPKAVKTKGRGGPRPKKSKEQKQAEKEAAEAAQAALDAGLELPPPKEEVNKIRIKISKNKGAKDDAGTENDTEDTKEPKDKDKEKDKEKDKVIEEPKDTLETRFQSKGYNQIYDQIWRDLARKDVNKVYKLAVDSYAVKASNLKKTAILASKEAKRWQLRTNKGTKDLQARAKRVMRDMMGFWKRNEREERDLRKAAEKQELENARKEEADREAARQKRKLNFLISQTELYSHFIGKKIKTDEVERSTDHPDEVSKDKDHSKPAGVDIPDEAALVPGGKVTNFENLDFDADDESTLRAAAMANAQSAIAEAQKKAREFNKDEGMDEDGEMNFQNPTGMGDVEIAQPKLLNCQLKEYQLKGLNWLVNLYEQGINGILADEMGLGKTVQSISVMAYLAEKYDVWGPFLVVAPASTLHNWQQEIKKFVPKFKVLPYWGDGKDRKVLRKFWDRKQPTYKQDADFHVMITSYQMVVSDVAYFSKMRWQYMILDEAQAIKSSQSSRWKCLLGFHCRNRLLLTGTPIQNNMQELWALLHFIMPSLFDSHDEFSEWFSKDIESHAQSNTKLNEDQLKRLHMILKPFMLRRVKKHVQKELGDKIELDVFCDLTYRQRALYANLRNQISIMDLIEKATIGEDDSASLMNLVMQFRKVCNHPDLFERADTSSPFSCSYFAETASFLREGNNVPVGYSARSLIEYPLPRLVWREGGRLHKPSRENPQSGFRSKYLGHMMNIWTPDNIRESSQGSDNFSWLRFADTSAQEVYNAGHEDLFTRASELSQKPNRLGIMNVAYDEAEDKQFAPAHALFNIAARNDKKALADITTEGVLGNLMNVSRESWFESGLGRLEQAGRPKATAPPVEVFCDSIGTNIERENIMFSPKMRKTLYGPNSVEEKALVMQKVPVEQYPLPPLLPAPDNEKKRFTNITVPSMRRFVTDSGKLAKLDELLFKLKEGGHRVLLYFQMTRMIDLMEEYLTYRNYKYCRLDGSTKLEDRRDTVADFQTRPEIFIFLLSTRAGGLGINLTSADTVIFYDSDWNPTIDSQAMDRAHRLGQTRQVTVYRLITRGTIEERIRKRAMQKEEVQRVVITGGGSSTGAGVDFSGRRAPENRNRDIALWLADDDQAEMIERREKELLESGELDKVAKKKGKRKRTDAPKDLDEMYHEGEGNFDDNKGSGTATPTAAAAGPAAKKARGGKKAKTTRQRLAIADGEMDG